MLKILLKYETIFALRNIRFLSFIILLTLSFPLYNIIYYKLCEQSKSLAGSPELRHRSFENLYRNYVIKIYENTPELKKSILQTDPVLVISFYLAMTLGPFVLIFLAFPVISGEAQNRTINYFILFSGRTRYYLGKILPVLSVSVPLFLLFIWLTYAINANRLIPVDFDDQLPLAVKFSFLASLYLVAVSSMIFMASVVTKTVYGSLGLGFIIYYSFFVLEATRFAFLSPTYFRSWIFYKEPLNLTILVSALMIFTLFFNSISLVMINRKEIT